MTSERFTIMAFFLIMMGLLPGMQILTSGNPQVMAIHSMENHVADSNFPRIYHEGTVESIETIEYQSIEEALIALNDGEIDIYGHPINASDYALVDSYTNIEKQWAHDNWIYTLAINTRFYPLGSTYLRRAIAYGISKIDIVEVAMNGTVDAVDFAVPLNNEYSIEGEEGGRYYEDDLANATDMLALAGMLDVDDDGMVEAPNGSDLCLNLWYPSDVSGLSDTASLISDDLFAIGINNTLIGMDQSVLQSEIRNHNLTYSLALYHQEFPPFSLEWISTTFKEENWLVPGENIANIDSSELNNIADEYDDNLDLSQAGKIGQDAMRTVRNLCPVVPLFEGRWLSVYSEDNFNGWLNETNSGSYSIWNPVSVQPIGSRNELRIGVLPSFFDDFFVSVNPFEGNPTIDHNWISRNCFNPYMLVFDSPLATLPNGEAVPRHATSWEMFFVGQVPQINKTQSRARYYLSPSANWTDGKQFDAQDYSFTFAYYGNYSLVENPELIEKVKVTGNYRAGITYNAPDIFAYRKLGELPILPSHIIEGMAPDSWNLTDSSLVGSGPYMISDFIPGESLTLERNPDYYPEVDIQAPTLKSKTIVPQDPIPTESVLIRVLIDDKSRLTSVTLDYIYEVGSINFTEHQAMIETAAGFEGTIPARSTANSVYYEITATDSWGNSAVVLEGSYSRITDDENNELQGDLLITMGVIGVVVIVVVATVLRRRQ
ncbi:MAG: ABC transporter substrate-binding protein [Candidatus Thorarchaeota archaeon]